MEVIYFKIEKFVSLTSVGRIVRGSRETSEEVASVIQGDEMLLDCLYLGC